MKVEFLDDVVIYFNELVEVLFHEEYFGFKESAYEYVDDIIDMVLSDLEKIPSKVAPVYFSRYGKDLQYIAYTKNKNTTWYIFFNHVNGIYYVRYIGSNHSIGKYL